jgi:hypothetical protein
MLYTLRGIDIFVQEIQGQKKKDLHDLTIAVRHSQATDSKSVEKFLQSLNEEE